MRDFSVKPSDSDRTACHILCRGAKRKEEMPDRAGEYIILGKTCSTRPAEFARSSLSASGLQTPLFAFSCVCSVGILGVCSGRGFCFYIAFATQKVSSSRGDARQGRGVDLSLLKRKCRGRCPARRPVEMATADLPRIASHIAPFPFFVSFPKELPFFFSLLKRKKEAKKEKLIAYPFIKRRCITRLAV